MGRFATVAERRATSAHKKGKLFTKLAKEIEIAARHQKDPQFNPRLRLAIQKAKRANLPSSRIERALKPQQNLDQAEELLYEALGPHQSSYLISILTDNRNRTHGEVRQVLTKFHIQMTTPGSVSWNYQRLGDFHLNGQPSHLESFLLEDLPEDWVVDYDLQSSDLLLFCLPQHFDDLLLRLSDNQDLHLLEYEIHFCATTFVSFGAEDFDRHQACLEKLDELSDVVAVDHNVQKEVIS